MIEGLRERFLRPAGWLRSQAQGAPVRDDGSPLPWFTYAAIELLDRMVRPEDRVFEYGAGFSTLWWQTRASHVDSVEHDLAWIDSLRPKLKPCVALAPRQIDHPTSDAERTLVRDFFRRRRRTEWPYDEEKVVRRGLNDERFIAYATHITNTDKCNAGYDFIVIDGMARRLCTWVAKCHLKRDGVLILDNANRSDYDLAYELLAEAGFRQIPLWGLVPGANFMTCTSFFFRTLERLPSAEFASNSFQLPEY